MAIKGIHFQSWWHALSAVPSTTDESDWWGVADGRHSRYARLYRCWSDPTDSGLPPYYRSEKEKHLVPTLWENFALFHPEVTIAGLYRALGFHGGENARDLCWSYEFNLGHQQRQIDLVLHVRFDDRDEVVVAEAKLPGKPFASKDLDPAGVLSHERLLVGKTARYFLIGDKPPANWTTKGYGIVRWEEVLFLQLALCGSLAAESDSTRSLLRDLISLQFGGHGIAGGTVPSLGNLADTRRRLDILLPTMTTIRCENFAQSAFQHIRCLVGLRPDAFPFAYLQSEPPAQAIKPGWRDGCGRRAVNEIPYWRLPRRRPAP